MWFYNNIQATRLLLLLFTRNFHLNVGSDKDKVLCRYEFGSYFTVLAHTYVPDSEIIQILLYFFLSSLALY